jgi:asparagine synthase (glutamine-hydrolysing)
MGMWAFAIWDKTKRRLFCSRDRFGIKPFYYFRIGEHFYFASEYKAIKELPMFRNELNYEQLNRGLQMVWTVYNEETFYKHLKTLKPAYNLVWEGGKIFVKRYWDVDFSQPHSHLSWGEKKEKFYSLFKESVKMHARSDVRNGTLLSGGLDSSSISSMYSTLMPDSEIKSFSIYYEGDGNVDERPYVHEVVKKYSNIRPFYFSPSDQEITDNFHKVAYHSDVPLLTSTYISQFFLMQLAKSEGVTVVLDGQGSDEYLGGYLHSIYRIIASDFLSFRPDKAFRILAGNKSRENYSMGKTMNVLLKGLVSVASSENAIYNLEFSRLNRYLRKNTDGVAFREKTKDKLDSLLYNLLFNTTLQTLLHYEDRNSMAFSIESRVPFLDHRLVEFAFTLRRQDKISDRAETK